MRILSFAVTKILTYAPSNKLELDLSKALTKNTHLINRRCDAANVKSQISITFANHPRHANASAVV
jgi:hypothetical protein